MQISSRKAMMFISLMVAEGATFLVKGAINTHLTHGLLFLFLLSLAVLTSGLTVKLPGITGNMSVNLPFLFLAIVQLTLFEAVLIAFAATLFQSLSRQRKPVRWVQVLFNVSTMTTAAGFAYLVFHEFARLSGLGGSAALVLAAATYFLINTLPVATIISLTEGAKVVRTWSGIAHLSFPVYVAGTGITSIVTRNSGYMAWALPLAVMPVMVGIYRSYRTYFGQMALAPADENSRSGPQAKRMAAGAL